MEPIWIERIALLRVHSISLSQFGGADGLRDEGLMESALMRPRNLYHYEQVEDVFRLAAAYAFGLAKNHPFVDGNKRAAFAACGMFLLRNGQKLAADKVDAYHTVLKLAAGEMIETDFAAWLRQNCRAA